MNVYNILKKFLINHADDIFILVDKICRSFSINFSSLFFWTMYSVCVWSSILWKNTQYWCFDFKRSFCHFSLLSSATMFLPLCLRVLIAVTFEKKISALILNFIFPSHSTLNLWVRNFVKYLGLNNSYSLTIIVNALTNLNWKRFPFYNTRLLCF